MQRWMSFGLLLVLSGCGDSVPAGGAKIAGPDPKTLTHTALMAIFNDCHKYGQIDDPRVKYTIPYCAAVESAHASEGWTLPSSAKVDRTVNALH